MWLSRERVNLRLCGRYELHSTPQDVARAFELPRVPDIRPRYNIAPSQCVPVVRVDEDGGRELVQLRWGLVPPWADDLSAGNRNVNAPCEDAAIRPEFRSSFRQARCLLPADGYYEWTRPPTGGRQPMRVAMRSGEVFALAGLWARWRTADGDTVDSCTLVTTVTNHVVRTAHARMPAIVAPGDCARWLDPGDPGPIALLRPYPAAAMVAYPVSDRVNSPQNDGPDLIDASRRTA